MDSITPGQLVTVADGGRPQDGIVYYAPSNVKVVVAVVDRRRGPLYRTVHPSTLSERSEEGPADPALRRLIRRTRPPVEGEARAGAGAGRGRAGHTRAAMHRTTGK
jgi:hypothetical protein